MRISFDVDDTLVCRPSYAPVERGWLPAFIQGPFVEPLRFGTRELVRELRRRGCQVWIYTSSCRSPFYIRLWLFLYGICIDGIVNDDIHRQALRGLTFSRLPSKYPPAFGIHLHIDDSEGVEMEGAALGFRVLHIHPADKHWAQMVLS